MKLSLLKACMSQDMELFKIKTGKNSNKFKKILLPVILSILFMYAIYMYLNVIGAELKKINLTYILLSIAMLFPTILTVIEGIYKSQGMLFEVKDNDLLFCLPIKKSTIIFIRLIKLYVFQYVYNLLFILPALLVYARYEKTNFNFWQMSIIMTFLLPIIPTILSCFIGAIIKGISVKFKSKKLVQIAITMIIFLGIWYLSLNTNTLINKMVANAESINNIITKVYYPIGAYINLITKFNIVEFLKWILINILPLILFVWIMSKFYFKIISKEKETITNSKLNKKINYKKNNKIKALVIKDLKRYFSSTVYVFNTFIGMVLLLIATIYMCINVEGALKVMLDNQNIEINLNEALGYVPKIFAIIILFTSCLTSITSSLISIEGKSFNITKSMPITEENILLSKIITSDICVISVILICDIIFFTFFKVTVIDIILILFVTFVIPTLTAIYGLLVNLKYPKLDASSDTEVVKQSASSMISVLSGMIFAIACVMLSFKLIEIMKMNLAIITMMAIILLVTIGLSLVLIKYGKKRIKEL